MPDNPHAEPSTQLKIVPFAEMTVLRDYFAAAALTGMLAAASGDEATAIAEECYALAEAMLTARQRHMEG